MKMTKRLVALALALALAVLAAGCGGSTDEPTTNDIYAVQGGSVTLPEGLDTSARFSTHIDAGTLYVSFNRIMTRNTGYFQPAGDTITLTAQATTESTGLLEYKAGLWKYTEGGIAEYVEGCTLYFTTGGDCYTGTFSGLDPNSRYKITLSYDSHLYYITGTMKIEGLASAEEGTDTAEDGDTAE